jgi:hypothetical protein
LERLLGVIRELSTISQVHSYTSNAAWAVLHENLTEEAQTLAYSQPSLASGIRMLMEKYACVEV